MGSEAKDSAISYAHTKGAVVLLSVGGSTEAPYSGDASAYGRTAANWAQNNGLDGVDFDLEKIMTGEAVPVRRHRTRLVSLSNASQVLYMAP